MEGDTPYTYYNPVYPFIYGSGKTSSNDIEMLFSENLYYVKSENLIWSFKSKSKYRYNMKSLDSAVTLVINKFQEGGFI